MKTIGCKKQGEFLRKMVENDEESDMINEESIENTVVKKPDIVGNKHIVFLRLIIGEEAIDRKFVNSLF